MNLSHMQQLLEESRSNSRRDNWERQGLKADREWYVAQTLVQKVNVYLFVRVKRGGCQDVVHRGNQVKEGTVKGWIGCSCRVNNRGSHHLRDSTTPPQYQPSANSVPLRIIKVYSHWLKLKQKRVSFTVWPFSHPWLAVCLYLCQE